MKKLNSIKKHNVNSIGFVLCLMISNLGFASNTARFDKNYVKCRETNSQNDGGYLSFELEKEDEESEMRDGAPARTYTWTTRRMASHSPRSGDSVKLESAEVKCTSEDVYMTCKLGRSVIAEINMEEPDASTFWYEQEQFDVDCTPRN